MKKTLLLISLMVMGKLSAFTIRPVPWITEEAIIFLDSFLKTHPQAKILEFGCGASTVWIAKRTENLVSVEHNPEWYTTIKNELEKTNLYSSTKLILKDRPYHTICDEFPDNFFDLILVDGRNRKACIMNSIRILKHGGVLMLDNAERSYYQCVIRELLQDWKFKKTEQTKPDSCNFWYQNWQTNWWIKP